MKHGIKGIEIRYTVHTHAHDVKVDEAQESFPPLIAVTIVG